MQQSGDRLCSDSLAQAPARLPQGDTTDAATVSATERSPTGENRAELDAQRPADDVWQMAHLARVFASPTRSAVVAASRRGRGAPGAIYGRRATTRPQLDSARWCVEIVYAERYTFDTPTAVAACVRSEAVADRDVDATHRVVGVPTSSRPDRAVRKRNPAAGRQTGRAKRRLASTVRDLVRARRNWFSVR